MGDIQKTLDKKIVFAQRHVVALPNDNYILKVEQEVNNVNGSKVDAVSQELNFEIKGMRFILNPQLIHNRFPAANAQGDFANVLPHIVLEDLSLPWQRVIGRELDGDGWLALLVFYDKEAPLIEEMPIRDLLATNNSPELFMGYSNDMSNTAEHGSDICQVIDVDVDLWSKIAPESTDLQYLAHVRQVSAQNKPAVIKDIGEYIDTQNYSTIIANRLLPKFGKVSMHLVSLEGLKEYLPDKKLPNSKKIRLVSLANWQFMVSKHEYDLVSMTRDLRDSKRALGKGYSLALDTTNAMDEETKQSFEMGYVPLPYRWRNGDKTLSWYRGPCLPHFTKKNLDISHQASSDYLLKFDPRTGMFDASYAVAWQLGRLLALDNTVFLQALLRWKHGKKQNLIDNLEREIIEGNFDAIQKALSDVSSQGKKARTSNAIRSLKQPNLLVDNLDQALMEPEPVPLFTAQPKKVDTLSMIKQILQKSCKELACGED